MRRRHLLGAGLAVVVAGMAGNAMAQSELKIGEINSYSLLPAFTEPYRKNNSPEFRIPAPVADHAQARGEGYGAGNRRKQIAAHERRTIRGSAPEYAAYVTLRSTSPGRAEFCDAIRIFALPRRIRGQRRCLRRTSS